MSLQTCTCGHSRQEHTNGGFGGCQVEEQSLSGRPEPCGCRAFSAGRSAWDGKLRGT
jgi:hypothetical protein